MKGFVLFLIVLFAAPFGTIAATYGEFVGDVVTSWDKDGRTMVLQKDFTYIDPQNTRWDAPAGSKIDGASIPKWAWSFIGGPYEGKYRKSSVIHDVACARRIKKWTDVHRAFHTAMLLEGAGATQAKIMFAAVYYFGPRWPERVTETKMVGQQITKETCKTITRNGFNETICSSTTTTVPKAVTTTREIPPPLQHLSREQFSSLVQQIEDREPSFIGGMTLEEIENYAN